MIQRPSTNLRQYFLAYSYKQRDVAYRSDQCMIPIKSDLHLYTPVKFITTTLNTKHDTYPKMGMLICVI